MTHVGCPSCRLRFTFPVTAYLVVCPKCGRTVRSIAGAEGVLGFSLFVPENDASHEPPEASAVAVPILDPWGGRS